MSGTKNHLAALACCWFMRQHNFTPTTLLNIGVGKTSPELDVWQWLLPGCNLIGIDPRWSPRGHWTKRRKLPQIAVAVGDGSITSANYCGPCRSLICGHPATSVVPVMTLDEIVAKHNLEPPFFIWMDIDGSEPEALRGATETLARTAWLNVELTPHFGIERCQEIRSLLASRGFRLHYDHARNEDELYRNRRYE